MSKAAWKCCGCGVESPDRVRACDCATNVLFHWDGDHMAQEVKIASAKADPHFFHIEQEWHDRWIVMDDYGEKHGTHSTWREAWQAVANMVDNYDPTPAE